MNNQKIYAKKEIFGGVISLYLISTSPNGQQSAAKPLDFEDLEMGMVCTPFLEIKMNQAQALIDQLWECGLRPSEGSGSAGALAATERHLADMQKLVFKGK